MRRIVAVPFMLLVLTLAAGAQNAAIAFCGLDQTVDFKTAKAGDKIALHLARDLVVNGKTLMPRGTTVSATVVDAKDGNTVSIVLDKATSKSGQEIPLTGIIAAVLATPPRDLTDDPFYGMRSLPGTFRAARRRRRCFYRHYRSSGANRTPKTRCSCEVEPSGRFKRSDRN